jgi:hypothetical protein
MNPNPPIRPSAPGFERLRLAVAGVLTLLLWLELLLFPAPPQTALDPSWNEVLVYAAAHGWQFGRDLVFTYGPWGYLGSIYHVGALGAENRLVWELAGKLLVAAGVVAATRRLPLLHQVLFIGGCLWFGWFFLITFYLVVIGVAVVEVLLRPDEKPWVQATCACALAFLGLLKFTDLVLATAGVAVAVALQLWVGRRRPALALAASYALSLLFWWIAAGQDLENIVPYVRSSLEITRGYASAMGLDESGPVLVFGLALDLGWLLFLLDLARRRPDRPRSLAAAAFLAITAFVLWKYGFTRGDAHTNAFFLLSFLLALVLPVSLMPERRWHWFWAAGLVGLLGFRHNEPALFADSLKISLSRIVASARALPRVPSLPQEWRQELGRAGDTAYLPATNRAVGAASVDLVSCDQGVVLINGLNYTPRPVFQSYSAYTPALAALNLAFYRSAAAPAFVLWRQETIDGRFPTIDDAPLVAEMPRAYEAQFTEGDYVILKRVRDLPARPQARVLLAERSAAFGEAVPVPESGGTAIWLQADLGLNLLGRARAALYRPPEVTMRVVDARGSATEWRIIPAVAADGFLLVPFLQSTADFNAFIRGTGSRGIRSVQFGSPAGQERFLQRRIAVRFWSLPELKLGPAD